MAERSSETDTLKNQEVEEEHQGERMMWRMRVRIWWDHKKDDLAHWIARMLPRRVAYWAAIRVSVYASTGEYSKHEIPSITMMEMLERWEKGVLSK
jgi:hypothetical protein